MSGLMRGSFIVALLFAAGCDFDFANLQGTEAPPARTCYDEKLHCDTARGEICRRADGSGRPLAPTVGEEQVFDGICVLTGTQASGQVFFEIQPADANAPRTQFGPVTLDKKQNQELFVPEPVAVGGLVTYTDTKDSYAVEGARVRFKSVPLIPGRALVFETQSSDEIDSGGRYERLLPQGTYIVTVQPREREEVKPPQERPFGDKQVPIDASTSELNLVVSNPNALLSVSGTVLKLVAGQEEPAVGVNVWAMAAENELATTPRAGTGTPIAQAARTGPEGRFTLWLPRATKPNDAHRIRLEVGPASDGAPFPTFRIDPQVWEVSESMKLPEPIVLSNGELGLESVKAQGQVVAPDGSLIAGARISFRTLDEEAIAFATTVLADDNGQFEASLFAGNYQATAIAPEEDSDVVPIGLCSLKGALAITNAPVSNLVLSCEKRRFLYGQVIDSKGQSVPNVTISAVRHPDARSADQLREERISDGDGRFRLALSPGTYDFTFAPPAAVAPLKTIENVLVDTLRSDSLLVFALDPPFELFGKVFSGKSGQPLGGTLDAWVVSASGQATLVGRGLAQRDGSYSIVLPAIKQ